MGRNRRHGTRDDLFQGFQALGVNDLGVLGAEKGVLSQLIGQDSLEGLPRALPAPERLLPPSGGNGSTPGRRHAPLSKETRFWS